MGTQTFVHFKTAEERGKIRFSYQIRLWVFNLFCDQILILSEDIGKLQYVILESYLQP